MKVCIRCHISQPLEAFSNYARYSDGKHRYCRNCWNAYAEKKRRERGQKVLLPFLERLWSSIEQCGHEETCIFCCWPWLKACDKDGYGITSLPHDKQRISIHVPRVVYEIWHGIQIPPGYLVCHYCDAPPCCNPLHLWLGTFDDNRQDCVRKGRTAKGKQTGVYTMPEAFPRGEQHHKAKLTAEKVSLIRIAYAQGGVSSIKLAEHYGVSKFSILCILRRKTWKHIP